MAVSLEAARAAEQQQGLGLKGASVIDPERGDGEEQPTPPARSGAEPAPSQSDHEPDGQSAAEQRKPATQPFLNSEQLIETTHQEWKQREFRFHIALSGAGPVDLGQPDRCV